MTGDQKFITIPVAEPRAFFAMRQAEDSQRRQRRFFAQLVLPKFLG
jgi:hypothetical protein